MKNIQDFYFVIGLKYVFGIPILIFLLTTKEKIGLKNYKNCRLHTDVSHVWTQDQPCE